jgi:GNAT superfamily N-acetyltransferase
VTGDPSFRAAAESDTATLLKFMQAYYVFDGHGFDQQKAGAALTTLLRDPNLGRVWLILDGDDPVGYVVICFGYSLEWLGRDAFVDEFYLLADYRGHGWGRKTMAFVEDAARSFNVRALHLEVVRQNAAALQVYRNLVSRNVRALSCRSGSLGILPNLKGKAAIEIRMTREQLR